LRHYNPSVSRGKTLDLPSFLWLWKIAAWSMGFSLSVYGCLALTGFGMARARHSHSPRLMWRRVHIALGLALVVLVPGLLAIGIVGTLGEYGSLGHSFHGLAGGIVVGITLLSVGAALLIQKGYAWARSAHVTLNGLLGLAFLSVLWTGWSVVQKYLP
jgi:Protein of unknown function (DUF4079)